MAGPFIAWIIIFTVVPLALMFSRGFTDKAGNFTLDNVMAITNPIYFKALVLALELSVVATVVCLPAGLPAGAHPARHEARLGRRHRVHLRAPHVDELAFAHHRLAVVA